MIIGIDIGTSNSSVCFINEKGDAVPVNISTGMSMYGSNFSLPSAVYVEDDGNVLVGQAALNSRLRKPQCFRAEFKRNLGESIPILLGDRCFLPEDLYTELFRHMLSRVQKLGQGPVEKAYVTHPASYGSDRRSKILSAAKAAGLFDVVLVDEPTSAAMNYLHLGLLKDGQRLLVYDFGGGTFDASVIQYKDGEFKALTEPMGLEHCGGIDIDRAIFTDILAQIDAAVLKSLQANPVHRQRLESQVAELAVKAKHHLTESEVFQDYFNVGYDLVEYALTREKMNGMIAGLVQKTIDCCRWILAEANLSVDKLDGILLVGGTSRIPLVMQMLGQFAGKAPIFSSVDLELAVAQGAACKKDVLPPLPEPVGQDNDNSNTFYDPNYYGFAVYWDGWVYYTDDNGIVKMKINGEHKVSFYKGTFARLCISMGYIYAVEYKENVSQIISISITTKAKSIIKVLDEAEDVHVFDMRVMGSRLYYHSSENDEDDVDDEKETDDNFLRSIDLITNRVSVHISNANVIHKLQVCMQGVLVTWKRSSNQKINNSVFDEAGREKDFDLLNRKHRSNNIHAWYHSEKGYLGYITNESKKGYSVLCFYDNNGNELRTELLEHNLGIAAYNLFIAGSDLWLDVEDSSENKDLIKYDMDNGKYYRINDLNYSGYLFDYKVVGDYLYYDDDDQDIHIIPITPERLSEYKSGGIATEGPVVTVDGWVYCINKEDEDALFKVRTDGTQGMKLSDEDSVANFLVIGNWVYYSDSAGIFKVKADGTEREEVISNSGAGDFVLDKGWIYFTCGYELIKVHADGSDEEELIDGVSSFQLAGEWIYYLNNNDGDRLYRIRVDGTDNMLITADKISFSSKMLILNDWIYYYNKSDNYDLYRIHVNGSKRKKLFGDGNYGNGLAINENWLFCPGPLDGEDECCFSLYMSQVDGKKKKRIAMLENAAQILEAHDNWIYYTTDVNDEECLFRVRADGTEITMITDDKIAGNRLVIQGDWIYYVSAGDDCLYKIMTNGKEKQCLLP